MFVPSTIEQNLAAWQERKDAPRLNLQSWSPTALLRGYSSSTQLSGSMHSTLQAQPCMQ